MTDETANVEAETTEEVTEDTNSEDTTEEVEQTEEVVEEKVKPQPKKLDKFEKILAEKNQAKKEAEIAKMERDVAKVQAKYWEIDEAIYNEIRTKHPELDLEEVYAIYSHKNPREQVERRSDLKVVGNKPVYTKKTFTYEDLSKMDQARYNETLWLAKQGKVAIRTS